MKTVDAYRLSAYFYKDRDSEGGKLVFGPIWDFDISLGLADYANAWLPSGWEADLSPYEGIWSSPFWVKKFFNDPVFKNKLAKRWSDLKPTVFNLAEIMGYLDQTILQINQARARNFIRWPIIGVYQWPEYYVGQSYEEEVLYLKGWIIQRYNWINANLSANYSDAEWLPVDFSKISLEPLVITKLPVSSFVINLKNISSVEFRSADPNISFVVDDDSVAITTSKKSDYTFKIIAKNNNEIVALSPEYKINQLTGVETDVEVVQSFSLGQNYPNPFNPSTVISWQLAVGAHVTLKVYDVLGNEVATLVNENQSSGSYKVEFKSAVGSRQLVSGIYFYQLRTTFGGGNFVETKKMLLLK